MMIDWSGLEEFRKTLPVDGALSWQNEYFQFLTLRWDIVLARFIVAKVPHEIGQVNVAKYMKTLGLPEKKGDVTYGYYVDEKQVENPKTDLKQPLLLAHIIYESVNGHMLIDGYARLVKAFRYGFDYLPAYKLTHEEEMACRI